MEWNDIYDENRRLTGRKHRRGTYWRKGEFGLVVCVWVHDGRGKLLMTRRAKGKSFAGTWENSGGAAKAGETSRQAVARELRDTSVVMTKFDIGDGMQAMIGVVGPTRMDYAKVTARLSYFAESLSKMFAKPDQKQLPQPEADTEEEA